MKIKTIKVPVTWTVSGTYEYSYPADMPEEEAVKAAIEKAEKDGLPRVECEYLEDSFSIDEEGINIEVDEAECENSFMPDLVWNTNPITEISYVVRLNRGLHKGEMISPGRYTIQGNNECSFDFTDLTVEAALYRDGKYTPDEEGDYVIVTHKNLDTKSYPYSQVINPYTFNSAIFTEIYIDLEGCENDLKVEAIFSMRITFKDKSDMYFRYSDLQFVDAELSFYHCIQLIDMCIKNNLIKKDPNNDNNILVYRERSEYAPEGWYSDNIHTVARELSKDVYRQRYLMGMLDTKGVRVEFTEPWWHDEKAGERV